MPTINSQKFERELKKGGAELLVLSLLEARPRHGYELRKLIETRSDGAILRLFLRQGGLVLAIGIVGGLFAAVAVAKTLASQLRGVAPFDVATLVGACAVMAAIGLLAILRPARRAAQQDPKRALNEN